MLIVKAFSAIGLHPSLEPRGLAKISFFCKNGIYHTILCKKIFTELTISPVRRWVGKNEFSEQIWIFNVILNKSILVNMALLAGGVFHKMGPLLPTSDQMGGFTEMSFLCIPGHFMQCSF